MYPTSERLLFRPYDNHDLMFLHSLLSDPEEVRFIGNGRTRDEEGAQRFLDWIYAAYKVDPRLELMVLTRKKDHVKIGHAGLVPQTVDGTREIEIGYWVARSYWNNGYATEAARALFHYGQTNCGIKRFIALIQSGNTISQKVAEKIGMKCEKKITLTGKKVKVYSIETEPG